MAKKRTIYRSAEGEAELMRLYDRALQRLEVECTDQYVDTRFGKTHLLCAGPPGAPPLVIFHGGNFVNPFTLAWFAVLADEYRIYAPDTVGHPGRSAQTRISPRDLSYGKWVVDILDGLGLECVPMVGPSYGAGIILRAAVCAPDRISRAVLVCRRGLSMSRSGR